jgi:hypothetical protein
MATVMQMSKAPQVNLFEVKAERAAEPARRKKSNPDRTVAALDMRQSGAVYRICSTASRGAEAAGKKATERMSAGDRRPPWVVCQLASQAVANEIYFEILDTVVRAAELAAARAAGFKTWDEFHRNPRFF